MNTCDRVHQSIEMILEKSEKIGVEKKEWSLDELYKASDIVVTNSLRKSSAVLLSAL